MRSPAQALSCYRQPDCTGQWVVDKPRSQPNHRPIDSEVNSLAFPDAVICPF
jgi:hypothetical protein